MKKEKDRRYAIIKKLIDKEVITSFSEIFHAIPKTVLARDMHMSYKAIRAVISNLEYFTVGQMYRLADLIDMNELALLKMLYEENMRVREEKGRELFDL